MARHLRGVVRVLTFAILLPASLPAQEVPDTSAQQLLAAQLRGREGTRIRVLTRTGERYSGHLSSLTGDSIRVARGGDSTAFAVADIDSLWTGRRAAGRGAKIGAISLGLAGGITLGLATGGLVGALCETDDCHQVRAGLVGGAIFGAGSAALGAGLGALIGSGIVRWDALGPAPSSTAPN